MLTGALVAIYNPLIDVPLWFPVVGEMDAFALTVLAVKMFVDRAPAEIVAEHQQRIALGTSDFDQDLREGLRGLRERAGTLLETGRERLRERLGTRGASS
jgi:hypothetical protein